MKNVKVYFNFYLLAAVIVVSFFVVKVTNSAGNTSQLAKNLAGKILLQVEENGEAWYVNPETQERSFLGRPEDAFKVMREEAVGITSNNLSKIPVSLEHIIDKDSDGDKLSDDFEKAIGTDPNKKDTDGDSFDDYGELLNSYDPIKASGAKLNYDNNFANKQKGKIFLDVERSGEAWYLNPEDGKKYFLGRPSDAFELMRRKGLGITNNNLNQIVERERGSENNSSDDSSDDSRDDSLSISVNYNEDILACAKNKSFNFTATTTHPFDISTLVITDNKAEIIGLNNNKCEVKFATLDVDYKQSPTAFYDAFVLLATEDGYSKEEIERLYNQPMENLNSEELKYLKELGAADDDLEFSLKDKADQFSSESNNEMLESLKLIKESLPMYEYCSGTPEQILELVNDRLDVDYDISYSAKISGSKAVSTYENGVICESEIIMTAE